MLKIQKDEKYMYKIYIDSAKRYEKLVALYKTDGFGVAHEVAKEEGDIDLVSTVAKILKQNNLKITDIAKFETNLGPGESFTGLKIGVAIVNTFNWALHKTPLENLKIPEYGREPNITPRKE